MTKTAAAEQFSPAQVAAAQRAAGLILSAERPAAIAVERWRIRRLDREIAELEQAAAR